MLAQQEREKILAELKEHPNALSAGVSVLKIIQEIRGWVSDDHLKEAAELIGVTPVQLEEVATFYNLIYRRPVGRHVIHVCDSIACWIMGSEMIAAHLENRLGIRLGQTTADGLVTLLPVVCLGNCDHAPSALIDGELYNDLDEEKLDGIIEGFRAEAEENG